MTLLYRLFGIPGDLDEVVDKARSKNLIPEVKIQRSNLGTLVPDAARYGYYLSVHVGWTKLTLSKWEESFNIIAPISEERMLSTSDAYAKERAFELADELSSKGLVVKLNGEFYNLEVPKRTNVTLNFSQS